VPQSLNIWVADTRYVVDELARMDAEPEIRRQYNSTPSNEAFLSYRGGATYQVEQAVTSSIWLYHATLDFSARAIAPSSCRSAAIYFECRNEIRNCKL
jgi:hypothetical protein